MISLREFSFAFALVGIAVMSPTYAMSQGVAAQPEASQMSDALRQIEELTRAKEHTQALELIKRWAPYSRRAKTFMGIYLAAGFAIKPDPVLAVQWFKMAAAEGDPEGRYRLASRLSEGRGITRDPVAARALLQSCADAEHTYCQNNLGIAMLHGRGGPIDVQGGVKYITAAALKGQVNALTTLADFYENGRGVEVDLKKAVQFYTLAAKQGFHIAHGSLASLYERGLGLPRNDVYAAMHYALAAQRLRGSEGSYSRQIYDQYAADKERVAASLSTSQRERAQSLAKQWPEVADPATEIANAIGSAGAGGRQGNSAIVSKLTATTALIIATDANGTSTGTGFWIHPDFIVTNRHVVPSKAVKVLVLRSGSSRPTVGTVVATTQTQGFGEPDFAVIKTTEPGQITLDLSTTLASPLTEAVAAGYPGLSIKNDLGFEKRIAANDWSAPSIVITSGQVSSVQRPKGPGELLMHTAQIGRGSSGGPLVDRCGRVIGVNTLRTEDQQQREQANFAIAVSALMVFLRNEGIPFTTAAGNC